MFKTLFFISLLTASSLTSSAIAMEEQQSVEQITEDEQVIQWLIRDPATNTLPNWSQVFDLFYESDSAFSIERQEDDDAPIFAVNTQYLNSLDLSNLTHIELRNAVLNILNVPKGVFLKIYVAGKMGYEPIVDKRYFQRGMFKNNLKLPTLAVPFRFLEVLTPEVVNTQYLHVKHVIFLQSEIENLTGQRVTGALLYAVLDMENLQDIENLVQNNAMKNRLLQFNSITDWRKDFKASCAQLFMSTLWKH